MANLRTMTWPQNKLKRLSRFLLFTNKSRAEVLHLMAVLADLILYRQNFGKFPAPKILFRALPFLIGRRRLGKVLTKAQFVHLHSIDEFNFTKADFHWIGNNAIFIPNGVPKSRRNVPVPFPKRGKEILVVGRIEPRKRQLEIAMAARDLDLPVTFVGSQSPTQRRYMEAFLAQVGESKTIKYLGPLSHIDTVREMGNHRVLLSASLAEVLSLVELEAASAQCFLVTCGAGSTRRYVSPDQFFLYPVSEIQTGLLLADTLRRSNLPASPSTELISWSEAADKFKEYYMYKNVELS